jgi:hypothetical protein
MMSHRAAFSTTSLLGWLALPLAASSPALAHRAGVVNHPPDTPAIVEPVSDGVVVNPADVHM